MTHQKLWTHLTKKSNKKDWVMDNLKNSNNLWETERWKNRFLVLMLMTQVSIVNRSCKLLTHKLLRSSRSLIQIYSKRWANNQATIFDKKNRLKKNHFIPLICYLLILLFDWYRLCMNNYLRFSFYKKQQFPKIILIFFKTFLYFDISVFHSTN